MILEKPQTELLRNHYLKVCNLLHVLIHQLVEKIVKHEYALNLEKLSQE